MEPVLTPGTNQYELFPILTSRDLAAHMMRCARAEGLEVVVKSFSFDEQVHGAVQDYLRGLEKWREQSRENASNIIIGSDVLSRPGLHVLKRVSQDRGYFDPSPLFSEYSH